MTLYRILYKSTAHLTGSPADLRQGLGDIVRVSAAANVAAGLTGALLLACGAFVQVIEGPMDPLEACFERICSDLRHRDVKLIKLTRADQRVFGQWPMLDLAPPIDLGVLTPLLKASDPGRLTGTMIDAVISGLHELGTRQRAGPVASASLPAVPGQSTANPTTHEAVSCCLPRTSVHFPAPAACKP